MSNTKEAVNTLAKLFRLSRSNKEMESFVQDFFTPSELLHLHERWQIVDHVLQGESQRSIRDRLGVSLAKVSRGAQVVKFGKGAFKTIWERFRKS